MKRGTHAADDGSFNRSAAINTGRAAVLLIVAFLIGVGLLHSADRSSVTVSAATTSTTKKSSSTTSSTTSTSIAALRDPSTVKVLAANATSTNGVGAKMQSKLSAAGYDALKAVTATTRVQATIVYYTAGFQGEATALASTLGSPASAVQPMPAKVPVPQLGTANILVLTGTDLLASLNTTTTTVKGTTGTTAHSATTVKSSKTTTTTSKSSSSSSSSSTSSTTSGSGSGTSTSTSVKGTTTTVKGTTTTT